MLVYVYSVMCELVLQSQLYMFRVHVVVGNLVGDTLGFLLRPVLLNSSPHESILGTPLHSLLRTDALHFHTLRG